MKVNENARIVREWMQGRKWKFKEKPIGTGLVTFKMSLKANSDLHACYDVAFMCREGDVQSQFFAPIRLSSEYREGALEYLARVNFRFRLGKFTVDMDDGEIRWETLKDSAALKVDLDDAMDDLIGFPGFVLDRFLPGLVAVSIGAKTAEQAFADCDRKESEGEPPDEEVPGEVVPEGGAEPAVGEVGKKSRMPHKTRKAKTSAGSSSEKPAKTAKDAASDYSLEGLNLTSSVPLAEIVSAVRKFREGTGRPDVDAPRLNILLSGAPGSGKTAFVKYLAKEVDAPLLTLKASDLLSRYSGETERRIAEAFSSARANGEILFLDEIDSFLQDRKFAERHWEVSQVNELLQQMEEFEGVMIGATNFADRLDRAVLRRFTYKLRLDYLTDEGKDIFFRRYFKTPLTDEERTRLNAIVNLTPGDFRTVRESLYYLAGRQTNTARLTALEAESVAKAEGPARIGF